MNVRTRIRSGQGPVSASNTLTNISQNIDLTLGGNGVNVATALNIDVIPQTSVAAGVATGGVSVSVNVNA